jgi:hypothetical protein
MYTWRNEESREWEVRKGEADEANGWIWIWSLSRSWSWRKEQLALAPKITKQSSGASTGDATRK